MFHLRRHKIRQSNSDSRYGQRYSSLEKFRGSEKIFLAGSSWRQDEEIIAEYINNFPSVMKWVFAPHEIDKSNIERLGALFKVKCVRSQNTSEISTDARCTYN